MKSRLDQALVSRGLVQTRSQAESYIKLGEVRVNGQVMLKPGAAVSDDATIELTAPEQYVSRAALKLASVAAALGLDFRGKIVLDVGSSTGGFTDYALRHGARQVIAVEVGRDQMHPRLRQDPRVELHERTDIREFRSNRPIDVVVADVSFISLREVLPAIAALGSSRTSIAVMVKPQFEAAEQSLKHKGVIKNDKIRRDILKGFEQWAAGHGFVIEAKADSAVSGARGNQERFYLLRKA